MRTAGWLIGGVCLLVLLVVMHHPVVATHDPARLLGDIRALASSDQWAHGALAVLFGLLTVGMFYFSSGLGWRKPTTVVAFLAFCLSLVFLCQAVMLDGFVTPGIAGQCAPGGGAGCAGLVEGLLALGVVQIEMLTRFALFAIAVAIAGWSTSLILGRPRALIAGGIGLASAAGQFWLLFVFSARLTPSTLLQILLVQTVWHLTVSVLMTIGLGPFSRELEDRE